MNTDKKEWLKKNLRHYADKIEKFFNINEHYFPNLRDRTTALTNLYFLLISFLSYLFYIVGFLTNLKSTAGLVIISTIGIPTNLLALVMLKKIHRVNPAAIVANYGGGLALILLHVFSGAAFGPMFVWCIVPILAAFLFQSARSSFILAILLGISAALVSLLVNSQKFWGFEFPLLGQQHIIFIAITQFNAFFVCALMAYIFKIRQTKALIESEEAKQKAQLITEEIKSVLELSSDAVFIINKWGKIVPTASLLSIKILEKSNLSVCDFSHFVAIGGCDEVKVSEVKNALNTILNEQSINFDFNENVLPRTLCFMGNKFHAAYSPVIINDTVDNIIVTLHDQTEIENSKLVTEKNEMIEAVFNTGSKRTLRFLQKTTVQLTDAKHKIEKNIALNKREAFISLHTAKGAAKTLEFNKLAALIHKAEQGLDELNVDLSLNNIVEAEKCIEKIHNIIDKFSQKEDNDFNIEKVEQAIAEGRQLQYLTSLLPTVKSIIDSFTGDVEKIARDLGKPVPFLCLNGDNLILSTKAVSVLEEVLVHLLRNSLDHGLESKDERISADKKEHGTITVTSTITEQGLVLTVEDDGQGLNLQKIKQKALNLNLIKKETVLSNTQLAELIFFSGLSTSTDLGLVSGRGVGMDAVKALIENKLGGTVSVEVLTESMLTPWRLHLLIPKSYLIK